jgi:hypothetical protein
MNPYRERMLQEQEESDKALFEKIKNVAKPDAMDLWALSPERFVEWRKLNDFPRLLKHFDKTLLLFKEWKKENKLSNEIIIENGEITPFLENKKLSKIKTLYLVKQLFEGKERTIVSYQKLDGEKQDLGRTFIFTPILEFKSYLDWLRERGKYQQILYINSRHSPNSPIERVFIHADVYATSSEFELLKMGGIPAPVDGFGLLHRGKKMEFVNLCGLMLTGQINFGELGNLSCSFCACDNWIAESLAMPLLSFEHCSITNFTLSNSKIQQWVFYNSTVTGDFDNTQFAGVRIFGGSFSPVLKDCSLFEVNIEIDKTVPDNNLYAYKTLKKIYSDQGDEQKAKEYFIKENEYIRHRFRHRLKGLKYFTKSLSYYYWEYGRKPYRIVLLSLAIILFFSFIYWLNDDLISINSGKVKNFTFFDSIYFSTTTFTTLGYGDMSPLSWLRIFTSVEAFSGVVNMGFLIAGYSNTKY